MKLSSKMKTELKKRLTSATAIIAVLVLVFACSKIDLIKDNVKTNVASVKNNDSEAKNEIAVIKDSTGINLSITGSNESGINKIEIYQGTDKIKEFTYSGNQTDAKEKFLITIPFGETHQITVMLNGETVAQKNVQNMRYISNITDLVAFRNLVNSGNSFYGKYVELLDDINMSSVCSSTVGSWTPIGTSSISFNGTFNGNNHTISNLYINNASNQYAGFFRITSTSSTIENVFFKNVYVRNTYASANSYTGGITGCIYGTRMFNCGVLSGSIIGYQTAQGTSSSIRITYVGSLSGYMNNGSTIQRCFNKASVSGTCNGGDYNTVHVQVRMGGLTSNLNGDSLLENCYNGGACTATGGYVTIGGLCGVVEGQSTVKNSYNYGNVSTTSTKTKWLGSTIGRDSVGASSGSGWVKVGTLTNCYSLSVSGTSYAYYTKSSDGKSLVTVTTGRVAAATLKTYASKLNGAAWVNDDYGVNNGYPILRWQIPYFDLNLNQTYINVGDQIRLTADMTYSSVALGTVSWASSDSNVAIVDSNGLVTAVGEGYATICATESTYTLRAMAVVNVAKQGAVTYAQADTGTYANTIASTTVLKENGTVWCYGDNTYGQLGDGTNISSKEPVQVMINKNTPLTNIVKISTGSYHSIALTKDGQVYTWGRNNNGQLGINNTNDKNYAVKVLSLDGNDYLSEIVDISAGSGYNLALGKDFNVYSWGENNYGQLGIGYTGNKLLPQMVLTTKAVSLAAGGFEASILHQSGNIHSWGNGDSGRLGTGNNANSYFPITTGTKNFIEIQRGHMFAIARTIGGTYWMAGNNIFGQFTNGTTSNSYNFIQLTLPSTVTETNKVKRMATTSRNIALLLNDGTIWTSGNDTYGQLSDGGSDTIVQSFVQATRPDGTPITDAKNIMSSFTSLGNSSTDTGYLQNLNYVSNDGYVYGVGDNTFGQLGNGTTTISRYYTKAGVPYLCYSKGDIELAEGENYTISRNDLSILNEFNVDKDFTPTAVGTLSFSTEDTNISVNSKTGKVTGLEEGYARVKITDETNGYETYVIVKVVNSKYTDIELGSKLSVGLTYEGKVWTWGSNTYGELGTNETKAYVDEPKEVTGLNNIKDIGVGLYHVVAVNDNGEVYTWGLNNNGQLGNGSTENCKTPIKINGLSNIVKVDAYKYVTTALDSDGNIYAWGEGYGNTPQKIYENILDMSENVLITSDRKIMKLDGGVIHNLRNVVKVSSNETTILAALDDGQVVSIDSSEQITNLSITNGVNVSCGNGFSYILDTDKFVYTYGVNNLGQLGIGNTSTVVEPTKVTASDVEVISAGEGDHGAYATFDGSIYTTGLNDKGQLGHKNIDNKSEFEIVLNVAIESNIDKVVEQVGESQMVDIGLGITLNLKKDLKENSTSEVSIVDSTIADLTRNENGTYNVIGRAMGRTFLNATITGNINGEDRQFATNVEVRIVPEGGITVPQIKSGKDFTVALKANGRMESWGGNVNGQLGIGNKINYDEPQELAELEETIVEIAVGDNHVLALTEEGTIYGWGLNDVGQVGNGTLADQVSQATVINIYGNELSKIIRVEAHGDNSFAINEDGEIFAWGKDFGSRAQKITGAENAVDVSTSYYVDATGNVYDMENFERLEIVGKVRAMDEGTDHTVFLTEDGLAYSIGDNTYGQLGTGNTAPVDGVAAMRKNETDLFTNIAALEAGERYTVIQTQDGKIYTVGINKNGEQGLDPKVTSDVSIPRQIPGITDVMLISAGHNHMVVAKTDGTTYSWGLNKVGQLGNRTIRSSLTPVMVGDYVVRATEKHVVEGKNETVKFKAYVDYFNIIKEDIIPISVQSKNTQVARASVMSDVDAQLDEEIGLTDDEIAKGYKGISVQGVNRGTTNIIITPTINRVPSSTYAAITNVEVLPTSEAENGISPMVETKANHTVTLKTNGTVWTYGQNTYGQLGIGSTETKDEPQQVTFTGLSSDAKIVQIAVGEFHSVALDSEGNVWTWGRNNYMQLGVWIGEFSTSPVMVTGIPKIKRIAAGNNSVMAITEDNKLVGWGQNAYGELGNGEVSNKQSPVVIEGMHDVLDIQGGKSHYVILKTDGKLYTVGSNLYGQLGVDLGDKTRTLEFELIESTQKFAQISSSYSSNMATTVDGQVHSWGQNTYGQLGTGDKANKKELTKVNGVSNIVEAKVGKTHSILRDYNEVVFLTGTNSYGQLGNATTDATNNFKALTELEEILRITAGNTYTAVMKEDGTVWAWGDYNHGNKTLKSRTNSKVPIQIGSDYTSLNILEVVVKKSEIQSIFANSDFEFNLIYDDENNTTDYTYICLNTQIARVNEYGNILGVRPGTTWVKATDKATGKVNVAIVRVIENTAGYETYTAPKVVTGDTYAASLKEDGSIFLWGYNDSEMVDSDVPYNANVVTTYVDLKSGKDHIVALRKDGTVWVAGQNTYGQLGQGNYKRQTKLVQVPNLTDIEKIAAGDNFTVAMDSYGIMYVWGEGYGNKPEVLDTNIRSASYIAAGGQDQIAVVLPSGQVYGFGSTLNGLLDNCDNAVKVEVGNRYFLILDTEGKVFKYANGTLTRTEATNAVDISSKNNVNIYQNVNERAFVWGGNDRGQLGDGTTSGSTVPVAPTNYGTDIFAVTAGNKNTYITDIYGNVYAAGDNQYGQLGNGTKEDTEAESYGQSKVHTLVGDRAFTVEPTTAIMEKGDTEELTVTGNSYNVFKAVATKNINDYDFVSADTSIIGLLTTDDVFNGSIKAEDIGKTKVTITDKVTNKSQEIERRVVPMDQKRLTSVIVNGEEAEAGDPSDIDTYIAKYKVQVALDDDENTATVVITTKEATDLISLDDGTTYEEGTLSVEVELDENEKITNKVITVKATNGTEFKYELEIEKISTNNNIASITVNGFEADASQKEENTYEIIVTDITDLTDPDSLIYNNVKVTAEKETSKVSIKGKLAEQGTQSYPTSIERGYVEMPIKVTSESGKAKNYTLIIYSKDEMLELESIEVNGTSSEKQEDGTYRSIIADDVSRSSVTATAKYDDINVGVNDSLKEQHTITRTVLTTEDENTETISLEAELKVDGVIQTITKDYTLKIYKNKVFSMLQEVQVNGEILEEENNTYIAYVASNVTEANIEITAKDTNYTIRLDDDSALENLSVTKTLTQDETTYTFTVTDESDGSYKTYTLKVIRGNTDTRIKKITVGKDAYVVEAELTDEEVDGKPVYEVKILDTYTNVDVTVQSAYKKTKISIDGDEAVERIAVKDEKLTEKTTELPIKLITEDGLTTKDYILRIIRLNDNTDIEEIIVNDGADITATEEDDTRYEVQLNNATRNVSVTGITVNENAKISINGEPQEVNSSEIDVVLTQATTEIEIKVVSEAGSEKTYTLTINTISDDVTLQTVEVDGAVATWNGISGRYEIKVDRDLATYNVEATTTEATAKVSVDGAEGTQTSSKIVTNTLNGTTTVPILVTAPNIITTKTYQLAIIEKSNNANLGYVKINGSAVAPDEDGVYNLEVVSKVRSVLIEIGAQSSDATVNLENVERIGVWKESMTLQSDDEEYEFTITAEDGSTTSGPYKIHITRLDGNTDIDKVTVMYLKNGTTSTVTPIKQEDGSYYIKIPRPSEERVTLSITAKKATTKVNVLGTEELGSLLGYLNLTGDITNAPIIMTAQDGTTEETKLIIEKESNDTSIKQFTALEGAITGQYQINADSKDSRLTITVVPTNPNAKVKLTGTSTYTSELRNLEIDIAGKKSVSIDVIAEDNETVETHTLQIIRTYNAGIQKVEVNGETAKVGNEINIIDNADAQIEITSINDDAEIQLLENGTVIGSGVGVLSVPQTLFEETVSTYKIKIIGPGEYVIYSKEYNLNLRASSTNTGARISVDETMLTLNEDTGFYEIKVNGPDHIIGVETASNYAKVSIEGAIPSNINQSKDVTLSPGNTEHYTITIIAENGDEEDYVVEIYRKSNDTKIGELTFTQIIDEVFGTEEMLTALPDGNYYKKINRHLERAEIKLKANDSNAAVSINNEPEEQYESEKEIALDLSKEIIIIPLKVIAEDGTEKTVNLKVERESNDVTLKTVKEGTNELSLIDQDTYKVQVDSRVTSIDFTAIPNHENAKVKLDIDADYSNTLAGVDVNIEGKDSFEVTVIAEDNETTKTYTIQIVRTYDASMKKLEVDDEEVTSETTAYEKYVIADEASHTIKVTSENSDAIITLYDQADAELATGTGSLEYTETALGTAKNYKFVIKGPDDYETFTKEYTLVVKEKSKDTTAKLYIDGTELTLDSETGKYRYVTRNANNTLKVEANNEFATISVNSSVPIQSVYERVHTVQTGTTETINVVVTSQNGESETYVVELVKLSNNANIAIVKVNDKESTKVSDSLYKNVQPASESTGNVVIMLEDVKASVRATVGGNVFDSDTEEDGKKKLEFLLPLPGSGLTEVTIEVTAEDGTSKVATLNIVQNPTNNINVTVKVNGLEVDQLDDSTYRIFVNNRLTSSEVNITAEDENTVIESMQNTEASGSTITFNKTLNTEDDVTVVNFTVTTQNGATKDCDLYIIKESTDNTIGKLYVNGLEINKSANRRYEAYIDNSVGNPTVKVVTNNEYAYVRIGTFAENQRESEQVVELENERKTSLPITIRSQSGENKVEHLDIYVTFVRANIDEVKVDNIEITDYDVTTKTYTAIVENTLEEHEIYVAADNSYMTLEINESIGRGDVTTQMSFEEGEEIRSFPLYVTGETGITEVYTIVLAQKSSNTNLRSVKVNDVSLTLDTSKNQYRKSIDKIATKAKIEVETEYPYAKVKVADETPIYGNSGIVWVDLRLDQDEITIPVLVTAADGTTIDTYNIVLTRVASEITGKIITQNAESKHVATIKVYRSSDHRKLDDELNPREVIASVVTNEDGTYSISVPNADNYDMIIEKEGYLTHTITNVKAVPYDSVSVKDTNIYAGNIIKYTAITQVNSKGEPIQGEEPKQIEQIEVQDLVALNDNYGEVITDANWLVKHIYDLNEDGSVDRLDRNILKANMNKKAETEVWTDPNAPMLGSSMVGTSSLTGGASFGTSGSKKMLSATRMLSAKNAEFVSSYGFIKPITCDYTVTSPYGERVHPVTGEVKKHNGIDLSGEHHTEIYAIADGEVTFAGVQNGYGNCIEIKHIVNGETIYSFYAHLSQINVKVGENVVQGQVIALEGGAQTDPGHGTSTGHHLHFEIRTASGSGHAVNPCDYINF